MAEGSTASLRGGHSEHPPLCPGYRGPARGARGSRAGACGAGRARSTAPRGQRPARPGPHPAPAALTPQSWSRSRRIHPERGSAGSARASSSASSPAHGAQGSGRSGRGPTSDRSEGLPEARQTGRGAALGGGAPAGCGQVGVRLRDPAPSAPSSGGHCPGSGCARPGPRRRAPPASAARMRWERAHAHGGERGRGKRCPQSAPALRLPCPSLPRGRCQQPQ